MFSDGPASPLRQKASQSTSSVCLATVLPLLRGRKHRSQHQVCVYRRPCLSSEAESMAVNIKCVFSDGPAFPQRQKAWQSTTSVCLATALNQASTARTEWHAWHARNGTHARHGTHGMAGTHGMTGTHGMACTHGMARTAWHACMHGIAYHALLSVNGRPRAVISEWTTMRCYQ